MGRGASLAPHHTRGSWQGGTGCGSGTERGLSPGPQVSTEKADMERMA